MQTLNISKRYRNLDSQKTRLVQSNPLIKNIWFSTKGQVKNALSNSENARDIFITLCPLYSDKWLPKWSYNSFESVWIKYQKKFEVSLIVLDFLKSTFNLKIRFLLADRWMVVKENIDEVELKGEVEGMLNLYNQKLSEVIDWDFLIETFSSIWIPIKQSQVVKKTFTIKDINLLLADYWLDINSFSNSLQVIITNFWYEKWYYLIKNYLETNQFLTHNFTDKIFVNTETTSPKNNLFTDWKYKLNENNLFVRVDINSLT